MVSTAAFVVGAATGFFLGIAIRRRQFKLDLQKAKDAYGVEIRERIRQALKMLEP